MENKQEKIYGIYSGSLKLDLLEQCKEYEVWSYIQDCGGYIWRMNHDLADNRPWAKNVDINKLIEAQYELEYLVYYTRKFGVTFDSEPKAGKHIECSESYNKWFQFWNNHFNNMSSKEFDAMNLAIENKEDLTKFLPKTKWNGEPLTTNNGANV